ncbi:SDR family NAD(P)-dependent oxidoreductase [Novosphingobium sp. G106]|uniref:polysaccharide biosynthesis protein n=1 Tax=Novosphingobium sp. G106 TaxID=2849500 RepID=UPI0020C3B1A7
MMLVTYAVACAMLPTLLVFTLISVPGVPRTMGVIQPILLLLIVLLSRLVVREWFGWTAAGRRRVKERVAIYGAGATGHQLALALSATDDIIVAAFIDDNESLHGQTINGIVVKSPEQAVAAIQSGVLTDILLAMPGATRKRRNEIIAKLRELPVRVQTVPAVSDLAQGKISMRDLRDLDIDDLLSREAVAPESHLLGRTITSRVVMVTGAGGSIGSELCRQILAQEPQRLLLVEQSEFALYQIHSELERHQSGVQIVPLLASVRDRDRIAEIVNVWRPQTVYHAAAYKHVPLVEHNVIEGIDNNVFGTLTVAEVSRQFGVEHFVLISTDKAVRPTNVMGATKRLAEMTLQIAALDPGDTCFSMVRFGNVLNSSGSVVPLFRRQIAEGGPITVTHPDITRFFMTIPEAAQLVIQAAGLARGGEVFVLDMGEPVRIYDLACNMISLSGLRLQDSANPDGDIAIEVVGLRPGEKLFEELLIGNNPMTTAHERIMKANELLPLSPVAFKTLMQELESALKRRDVSSARDLLLKLVTDYKPEAQIVDWAYQGVERRRFARETRVDYPAMTD